MPIGIANAISVPLSQVIADVGANVNNLLLEDGFDILLEDSFVLLLE